MKDKIIVKRYAEAYLSFAKAGTDLKNILQDFKNLKSIMRNSPEFIRFLESQEISYAEKCAFLDRVISDGFSPELRYFLKLLLEKGRINKAMDIAEYVRVEYSPEGEGALLKTSFPLDLELIEKIEKKLEEKLQKKLKFYIELDPELLGGLQVVVGNKVIDGSVRRRIDELKEKLLTARM